MEPTTFPNGGPTTSAHAYSAAAGSGPAVAAQPVEPMRLTLLTAILYNPLILIGYLLYEYGPSQRCMAGPLCQFGSYPGYLQLVLVGVGAWLLWLLLQVGIRRVLESPGWQGPLPRALRAISAYESVRELMGVLGVALMAFLVVALLSGHLTTTNLILGAFTAGVSIRAGLVRDDPAVVATAAPAAHAAIASATLAPNDRALASGFAPSAPYAMTPTPLGSAMPYRTSAPRLAAPATADSAVGDSALDDATFGAAQAGGVGTSIEMGVFGAVAPAARPLPPVGPPDGVTEPGYSPPPEFLPPPNLLPADETTLPPGWRGQEV
jgi:hypothetical protein